MSNLLFPLLLVLLAVPLFLSARKQKRAAAEQQQLLSALEPGDRVMTTSGLYATVTDASDDATIDLEIADGVVTTWLRAAVRERVLDSSASDAPTSEIPASDDTVSDTPPSGTPAVAADQPALDGPVGTGARVDAESAPTADAPRDANGTSRA